MIIRMIFWLKINVISTFSRLRSSNEDLMSLINPAFIWRSGFRLLNASYTLLYGFYMCRSHSDHWPCNRESSQSAGKVRKKRSLEDSLRTLPTACSMIRVWTTHKKSYRRVIRSIQQAETIASNEWWVYQRHQIFLRRSEPWKLRNAIDLQPKNNPSDHCCKWWSHQLNDQRDCIMTII